MYTVARFTFDAPARAHELVPIGEQMNAVTHGVFEGLRARGDGFACDVERSPVWSEHVRAIEAFVGLHVTAIRDARALGASVVIDIAIDAEDRGESSVKTFGLPPALLASVGACGITVALSLYM